MGTKWIQLSGWLSFFSYVIAECISYYNVATTNEWWAAAEVIVDGLAFLIMFPAALYLFIHRRYPVTYLPTSVSVLPNLAGMLPTLRTMLPLPANYKSRFVNM